MTTLTNAWNAFGCLARLWMRVEWHRALFLFGMIALVGGTVLVLLALEQRRLRRDRDGV